MILRIKNYSKNLTLMIALIAFGLISIDGRLAARLRGR